MAHTPAPTPSHQEPLPTLPSHAPYPSVIPPPNDGPAFEAPADHGEPIDPPEPPEAPEPVEPPDVEGGPADVDSGPEE